MFLMWVYLESMLTVVLFLATLGERSDSGHCPPLPSPWRVNVPKQGQMFCLKKDQDFVTSQ